MWQWLPSSFISLQRIDPPLVPTAPLGAKFVPLNKGRDWSAEGCHYQFVRIAERHSEVQLHKAFATRKVGAMNHVVGTNDEGEHVKECLHARGEETQPFPHSEQLGGGSGGGPRSIDECGTRN